MFINEDSQQGVFSSFNRKLLLISACVWMSVAKCSANIPGRHSGTMQSEARYTNSIEIRKYEEECPYWLQL